MEKLQATDPQILEVVHLSKLKTFFSPLVDSNMLLIVEDNMGDDQIPLELVDLSNSQTCKLLTPLPFVAQKPFGMANF